MLKIILSLYFKDIARVFKEEVKINLVSIFNKMFSKHLISNFLTFR